MTEELTVEDVERLEADLKRCQNFSGFDLTVPLSIAPALLAIARQKLTDEKLEKLGREHNAEEARQSLEQSGDELVERIGKTLCEHFDCGHHGCSNPCNWKTFEGEAVSIAGLVQPRITALEEEVEGLREASIAVKDAWESLPEGHYDSKDIQQWILNMWPTIDALRAALTQGESDDK